MYLNLVCVLFTVISAVAGATVAILEYSLVVIVYGNGKSLFGIVLTYNVIVKYLLYALRLRKCLVSKRAYAFLNFRGADYLVTAINTVVAYIKSRG